MSLMDKFELAGGRLLSLEELHSLKKLCPVVSLGNLEILSTLPIVGCSMSVSENDDLSEMGAELQIMTAEEIADEATNFYPGIPALPLGYLPIAKCLEGSGDPYFIKCPQGTVVRIPHEAVDDDGLLVEDIETVATSLRAMLETASCH